MEKLTCAKAKQIDLVDYLNSLGHVPKKITNSDYWYLSPLREEKTASFKVNRKQNIWYDHASGRGGNLIDFGILYHQCSVAELLLILAQPGNNILSFQQPIPSNQTTAPAGEKKDDGAKILVLEVRSLSDKKLLDYLAERNIPAAIANAFCKEVDFELYGRKQRAIGFENNDGGYELRNRDFKGSSSPKGITFLDNGSGELKVFEGFVNFLSFLATDISNNNRKLTNFLVLNSLVFFSKSRELMEGHRYVHLYLDRDNSGIRSTLLAQGWNREKYIDHSSLYKGHKDVNEWLRGRSFKMKGNRKMGRGL